MYGLDLAKSSSAPGLACQTAFKKSKVKVYLLTDINMLLLLEKDIRGRISHSINISKS